jgi:hypothetical protein
MDAKGYAAIAVVVIVSLAVVRRILINWVLNNAIVDLGVEVDGLAEYIGKDLYDTIHDEMYKKFHAIGLHSARDDTMIDEIDQLKDLDRDECLAMFISIYEFLMNYIMGYLVDFMKLHVSKKRHLFEDYGISLYIKFFRKKKLVTLVDRAIDNTYRDIEHLGYIKEHPWSNRIYPYSTLTHKPDEFTDYPKIGSPEFMEKLKVFQSNSADSMLEKLVDFVASED